MLISLTNILISAFDLLFMCYFVRDEAKAGVLVKDREMPMARKAEAKVGEKKGKR